MAHAGRVDQRAGRDAQRHPNPFQPQGTDRGGRPFTIRDGATWEDGSPVTCEDVKYGVSRVFASDVITDGPQYAVSYLDIPKDKDGASVYKGPYDTSKANDTAAFDKAVTCDGKTITYNFNAPFPDFPLAIANLRAFDPYRKDQDKGENSIFSVFSDGPYQLEGTWDKDKGGPILPDDDEIVRGIRLTHGGKVVHERLA